MAVVLVKNDKGEFVDVPYFVAEGGGGESGGGASAYEQVVDNRAFTDFSGFTITGEQAQKLADANEIYVYANFSPDAEYPLVTVKLSFRFSNLRTYTIKRVLKYEYPRWIAKITKLNGTQQGYTLEDCLYGYGDETQKDIRHIFLDANMPYGELPSLTVSVVLANDETQSANISGGGGVFIYAR